MNDMTANGTTQSAATAIRHRYVNATTAVENTGVRLPPAFPGERYVVSSDAGNGANPLQIYPAKWDQIFEMDSGGLGVDQPWSPTEGEIWVFECAVAAEWACYRIK